MEPNTEEFPIVKVTFDEVEELADLIGLHQDLTAAVEMAKRLYEMLLQDEQERDGLLVRSLYTSTLVTYVRCFATGKRYGVTEKIFAELQGEPISAHRYYKDMRDKHIAHSVNPFEQTQIGVVLTNPESEIVKVQGIAYMTMYRISDTAEDIQQLGLLAGHALRHVAQKAQVAKERILSKANLLTPEQLLALPRLGMTYVSCQVCKSPLCSSMLFTPLSAAVALSAPPSSPTSLTIRR